MIDFKSGVNFETMNLREFEASRCDNLNPARAARHMADRPDNSSCHDWIQLPRSPWSGTAPNWDTGYRLGIGLLPAAGPWLWRSILQAQPLHAMVESRTGDAEDLRRFELVARGVSQHGHDMVTHHFVERQQLGMHRF